MAFSNSLVNKNKKRITRDIIIISISVLCFAVLFTLSLIFVNDSNKLLLIIINSAVGVLVSWVVIYIVVNSLAIASARLSVLKRINSYEEEHYEGKLISLDRIRTVDKRLEAREIEIEFDDKNKRIFYMDIEDDASSLNVGDNVKITAKYHYLMEIEK